MDGNTVVRELLEIADKPNFPEDWDQIDLDFVKCLEGREFGSLSITQKKRVRNLYSKLVE